MKPVVICTAILGLLVLAACGTTSAPEATLTPANPVISATENANTTTDSADSTLGDQDVTFTADISDGTVDDFNVAGRFSCLEPVASSADTSPAIPGSLQISGVDATFRLITVNLPFAPELGTHAVESGGGIGTYMVEVTLNPSDPNALYRSTSGTLTIDALPTAPGDRVTGSFDVVAAQVTGESAPLSIVGAFDFLADDTSRFCLPQ